MIMRISLPVDFHRRGARRNPEDGMARQQRSFRFPWGFLLRGTVLWGLLLAAAFPASEVTAGSVGTEGTFITVASTTSTRDSGLFDDLLPRFTAKTGIEVRVVAVGTGQAIRLARNGDADVLFVHDLPSETKFVEAGFGVGRRDVMYNDFVVVGPRSDPAGIKGGRDAAVAFRRIARTHSSFVSRGDNSGTNKAERRIWKAAHIDPTGASGEWYLETGSGMGAALNTSAAKNAYSLSDRGTWLKFRNPRELTILVEGDPRLFNQYGITLVNPARFPHVKAKAGRAFIDWITSWEGQQAIAEYRINGKPLFVPNYRKPSSQDQRHPSTG
jgi:tungstate transport system substrate-binding protein